MSETQISAYISKDTKRQLERYAAAHGLKQNYLLESALLHHLQALRELPPDVVVPPRLVLTPASFAKVAKQVARPPKPTADMKALRQGKRLKKEPAGW